MTENFSLQKAREICGKLREYYESGRHPECEPIIVSDAARLLPAALDRIGELEDENERLAKMFAEGVYIESAHLEPDHYNIRVRGEGAMLLAGQIVKMFRDSGGKNFLTNTMAYEFGDPVTRELYELTIQKVDGEDSPAQKLQRQTKRITELENALIETKAESDYNFEYNMDSIGKYFYQRSEEFQKKFVDAAREQLEKEGLL